MRKFSGVARVAALTMIVGSTVWGQSVVSWNFGTASAAAGPSAGVPVQHVIISDITQGNSNGASTLLSTTSASTGYAGASGQYNAGVAAKTGSLVTGTSGSGYFEFTLSPDFASTVTLTDISFGTRSTSTGAQAFALRSSSDAYASDIATGVISNNATWALISKTGLSKTSIIGTPLTFRIYGYNGTGSASTGTVNWRIDDLSITLSVAVTGNPGSGIGAASVSPYLWKYSTPTALQFVVKPASDTINGVRIVRPPYLTWNTNDVTKSVDSATLNFFGDTVQVGNIGLVNQDSLVVTIANVTAADSTDIFPVTVQTFKGTSPYGRITLLPQMLIYGAPRPISVVKRKDGNNIHALLGKWAVMKGVVTVSNEFAGGNAPGGPVYIQDATGGATLYDSSLVNAVQHGDEIVVLGLVAPFNDLFELAPCSLLEIVSEGKSFDTSVVTIAQLTSQVVTGPEPYEGRLVRINNITAVATTANTPAPSWAVSGSGTNYNITDVTGTMQARISPRINLANLPTPVGKFDLVCVVGQFTTTYQVLPRSVNDVIPEGNGPRFSSSPALTSINPTSLSFSWTTDVAGSSIVKYGPTISYDSTFTDTNKVVNHTLTLNGLTSATVYQMQFGSANVGGTTYTQNGVYSTSSQNSTGTINVFFNRSVNTSVSGGENAQTTPFPAKAIARINAAAFSIDAAIYSLSGTAGASIATALVNAKGRGVSVRIIGEKDNSSTAPWTTLASNGIPVIFDDYDALNAGAGLMHNKFYVFDNRDASSETDDWLIAGSWNATDPGSNDDSQNILEIQDRSLANAYTIEFNEMWGSTTITPNASVSRFGARKYDNTPHFFSVGGIPIESYFSPSDRVNSQLLNTLGKATYSIEFALLTFTRSDVASLIIAKKNAGIKVHGVVDNRTDQGAQYDSLLTKGVDVHLKGQANGLLHHKYAVIDGETTSPTQYVITGSHNWSSSAENANNENTLIIKSKRIANLYLQEFKARYLESGGVDNVTVSVDEIAGELPHSYSLDQNYPNPFNPTTSFRFSVPTAGPVSLKLYNLLGQEVATLVNEMKNSGIYQVTFDASRLASGIYVYRIEAGNFSATRKMTFVK